jgi:hypothetical protein
MTAWVNSCLSSGLIATSAPGAKADIISSKAEVEAIGPAELQIEKQQAGALA